jgi:cell shape-determining protein MreC
MKTNTDNVDVIDLLRLVRVQYEKLILENQELKLKLSTMEIMLESAKQSKSN